MGRHHTVKRAVFSVTPAWLFFRIAGLVYRVRRRVNPGLRFSLYRPPRVFLAAPQSGHGMSIYFASPLRMPRYFVEDGVGRRVGNVGAKYTLPGFLEFENGDEIIVDIGANVGEFSMAAWPAKRLIAIEPDPNCQIPLFLNLRGILRFRDMAFEIVPSVVGDIRKRVPFNISTDEADSSIFTPPIDKSETIELQMEPLAEILARRGVTHVNFLKIEAEGAEPEVLEGVRSFLPRVHKIAVDGGPERNGEPTGPFVALWLREHGFEVREAGRMVFAVNPNFQAP